MHGAAAENACVMHHIQVCYSHQTLASDAPFRTTVCPSTASVDTTFSTIERHEQTIWSHRQFSNCEYQSRSDLQSCFTDTVPHQPMLKLLTAVTEGPTQKKIYA